MAEKLRDLILASLLASNKRESSAHRNVMKWLEKYDANNLEINEVVVTYAYLVRAINKFAYNEDLFIKNSSEAKEELSQTDYGQIDEEKFPLEIAILESLSPRLSYSAKFSKFLEDRTHLFAAALKKDEQFQQKRKLWGKLSRIEKTGFLDYFVQKMMSAFSDENFTFIASLVEIFEDKNLLGTAHFDKNEIAMNLDYVAETEMNRTDALDTALHEGIHNIITQLALAHRMGKLRKHPLAIDIWLADLIKTHAAHAPSTIWSIYWKNPEEILCRKLEEVFAKDLGWHGKLWRKLNSASTDSYAQKLNKPLSFLPKE